MSAFLAQPKPEIWRDMSHLEFPGARLFDDTGIKISVGLKRDERVRGPCVSIEIESKDGAVQSITFGGSVTKFAESIIEMQTKADQMTKGTN